MNKALVEKYSAPVPRYTSYPTAPHFSEAVGADTYAQWLSEVPAGETLSLYAHIPFCDSLCWFCGCNMKVVNRYRPIAAYLEALDAEIDAVAAALGSRRPVGHIHFGGGSPTILSPQDFRAIIDRFSTLFAIEPDAEIAVEVDPRGMTKEYVDAMGRAGVTRVSLGVQDLAPAVQEAVNRIQPFDETQNVADWCQSAGIGGLNIDLMYGLPHQTVDSVRRTAERIAAMGPGRVALFGYAHVPWMKAHQKLIDPDALPDGDARWEQSAAASEAFVDAGYQPVGLDHFARPDDSMAVALAEHRLRRNFQGYTTDESVVLVGFGASAVGALPNGLVQNASGINDYAKTVRSGGLPAARGVVLDDDDRLRAAVIERLMCDLEVDLGDECRARGVEASVFDPERRALAPLVEDGIVEVTEDLITIPAEARPFARVVAAVFDRYLESSTARHSRAV